MKTDKLLKLSLLKRLQEKQPVQVAQPPQFIGVPVKGEPGYDGRDGKDGRDGIDGRDGVDGKDGPVGPIGPKGEPGRDGIDGKDGKDGSRGLTGPKGKDGRNGIDGKDGKSGRDGRDGSPDTGTDIVEKINNLSYRGPKIKAEHIEGLSQIVVGGVKRSSSGSGFTVETPVGSVNASNTTFTVTSEPKWVVSDASTYFDGLGYTFTAPDTITMDVPPSYGIRAII